VNFIKNNSKKKQLTNIFLVSVIFFISDDTVTFGTNINQFLILLKYGIYFVFSMLLFIGLNFGKNILLLSSKEILTIFAFIACFFVTISFNGDFRNGYFLQLLTLLFATLIVKFLDFDLFIKCFSKILFVLSLISLLILLIANLIPSVLAPFPETVNFGGVIFKNLLVCAVFTETNFLRNTSIFREPGVFVIYLLFGIIIEFFYNKILNKKYLIVFLIAVISTLSTSGIGILFLLLVGYMFKVNKFKIYLFVSTVLILSILTLIALPDFSSLLFSKMDTDSSDYVSTLARLSSFSVPFYIFLNNPVTGVGLTNFVTLYSIYSVELFGVFIDPESASTNTIINTFAIFGFFYGGLMLLSFFKISKRLSKSTFSKIIVLVSILLMFSTQEMRYSLFVNVLFMYGLMSVNLRRQTKSL